MDFPDGLHRGRHRGWREGLSPTDRPLLHRTLRETNPFRDARYFPQTLSAASKHGMWPPAAHLPANLARVIQALGQAQRSFNQGRLGTAVPTCSKFDIQDAAWPSGHQPGNFFGAAATPGSSLPVRVFKNATMSEISLSDNVRPS